MRVAVGVVTAAVVAAACGGHRPESERGSLEAAARSYVELVLALGERDSDSLDSYHGPPAWQAEVRARNLSFREIRAAAASLLASLQGPSPATGPDAEARRAFLVRQLDALERRIDVLQGARPPFEEESRWLFHLDLGAARRATRDAGEAARIDPESAVRVELDRQLPGRGDLVSRYAAFDRRFVVPADRLGVVLARALDGCRSVTRTHVTLPPEEHVSLAYVRDLPWSAFTRYEGHFASRVMVNVTFPLTVDRALDLACHEAYPGHHTLATLLDARFGVARPEFLVQPLFSPQTALQEAAASLAPALAFPEAARLAFERDELFPLAGLDRSAAARYVRVGRLVDELHTVEGEVVRRYLDGAIDFPHAAQALADDALMPSGDATLKFVNQFRSYAATYTFARDALAPVVGGDWQAFVRVATDPAQAIP